jgi:regulator of nonsense transcripts 2
VDRILEEIHRGLDVPQKREPQRILGLVRLLGELYNYSVISAPVIYELLYTVINHSHRIESSKEPLLATVVPSTLAEAPHKYDPRILSDLDPPGDLFRGQLVCEALNTCGAYYVRGQAKDRLSRYLVYFQRYLLTKPLLPTHIEFAILDTFDNLEELARAAAIASLVKTRIPLAPKGKSVTVTAAAVKAAATSDILSAGPIFPRYDSIDLAQAAIEVLEVKPESAILDVEEEEDDDEDEAEGEESLDGDVVDDEDAEEREREEMEEALQRRRAEEEEQEMSEREAARMMERMRASEEDDEFERAFRSMVQESVQGVKTIGTFKSGGTDRMAIPAVLPKPKNIIASRFRSGSADDDDLLQDTNDSMQKPGKVNVAFKLLSRDTRGRIETRQLLVPEDAAMAIKLAKSEAALKLERQKLKERVLQIESLAEMGEEPQAPIGKNFFFIFSLHIITCIIISCTYV